VNPARKSLAWVVVISPVFQDVPTVGIDVELLTSIENPPVPGYASNTFQYAWANPVHVIETVHAPAVALRPYQMLAL